MQCACIHDCTLHLWRVQDSHSQSHKKGATKASPGRCDMRHLCYSVLNSIPLIIAVVSLPQHVTPGRQPLRPLSLLRTFTAQADSNAFCVEELEGGKIAHGEPQHTGPALLNKAVSSTAQHVSRDHQPLHPLVLLKALPVQVEHNALCVKGREGGKAAHREPLQGGCPGSPARLR
jgi:hypothetical protein